jgi:hypothetical protein
MCAYAEQKTFILNIVSCTGSHVAPSPRGAAGRRKQDGGRVTGSSRGLTQPITVTVRIAFYKIISCGFRRTCIVNYIAFCSFWLLRH